jgi:hypothetical protein
MFLCASKKAIDDMNTQLKSEIVELNLKELCVPFGAGLALRCTMQGVCFFCVAGVAHARVSVQKQVRSFFKV